MHRASPGTRILPVAIFAVAASLALALPVCAQSDEQQRRYEEWKEQEKARQEAEWRAAVSPLISATISQVTPALFTPGSNFHDCPKCPEMVVVPAGTFTMGSLETEEGQENNETPQHRVTIAAPFALGKYEVTFAEWDACVAGGGCRHWPDDAGWGRGDRPVVNVSWDDAQEFTRWLSARTGQKYRLPSESEWEYAARAGTTTPFHFGATITPAEANLFPFSTVPTCWRKGKYGWKLTCTVGGYSPNSFGLHDVHGNVWEWIADCWNGSYTGAPSDGEAWLQGNCERRVVRGGSFGSEPKSGRSAKRARNNTGIRVTSLGFRVARTLDR